MYIMWFDPSRTCGSSITSREEKLRAQRWLLLWFFNASVKVCLQNILKLQKDFKTISHRGMHYSPFLFLFLCTCMHCTHIVCHSFLPDRHIFYALCPWWWSAACAAFDWGNFMVFFHHRSLAGCMVGTYGMSNLNTVINIVLWRPMHMRSTPIHALWLVVINC